MQGDRPRSESAAPQATSSRRLVALTHDPALVEALRELGTGEFTINRVDDLQQLADELMQQGQAVALLDAHSLTAPVDATVDAVKGQFPDARLMVAGHAGEQAMLASRISQQRVFRFVHKPASTQRLKLFLDAAAHAPASDATTTHVTLTIPAMTQPPRSGVPPVMLASMLAATALVIVAGWWFLGRSTDQPVAAPAVVERAAPSETTALLARADQAFAAGIFVAYDGSSAAEIYRSVLRTDARNAAATQGFERSVDSALGAAEQALLAGDLEQARGIADAVRLIQPEHARLGFLLTQIDRELTRVNADVTQRQALESRQTQVRDATAVVAERIASGALIEPERDSALAAFREAQKVGAGDPLVRASRDTLVGALLTAADREFGAGRSANARRLVDAAGSVNSSASGLDIMRRRIEEASGGASVGTASGSTVANTATSAAPTVVQAVARNAESPALPAAPAQDEAQTPPEQRPTGSAGRTTASEGVISAATLRTTRRIDPIYPQQALSQGVSGWVELEFTITAGGDVKDVIVTASEPGRTFDASAMAALKRYRYAPVLRDGAAVEQRARLRIRFTAQNQ